MTAKMMDFNQLFGTTTGYVLSADLYQEPSTRTLRQSGVRYVPFLNYDNDLLKTCQAALNTSPTTNAIVRQKTNMSLGEGFQVTTPRTMLSDSPTPIAGANEQALLEEFLAEINGEGQTMMDLLEQVYLDVWGFGNSFIEVQNRGNVWSMRHLPIYMVRPRTMLENELFPTHVGVSDEFEKLGINRAKVEIPLWPKKDSKGRSVIHIKKAFPNFFYWGFPDWFSARLWAEIEYRVPRFNVAKLANGYYPSAIVNLFSDASDEDKIKFKNEFVRNFTDTGNNSKMFVQVLQNRDQVAQVTPLETRHDGEFLEIMQMAKQGIITAHAWSSSLVGEATPGQLGTNQQIRDVFDVTMATVIRPMQKLVLDSFVNPVLKKAGFNVAVKHIDLTPVSFMSQIQASQVLTQDEQREILGYKPVNQNQINDGNTN
jgi:hypothetical protein